jgi:hypothetical protein
MNWYVFGGMERGISLGELMSLPLWLVKDFRYLLGELKVVKREREEYEKMAEESRRDAKGVNKTKRHR